MLNKICILLGTRPEIIKLSPVIRECEKQKLDYFILHTNQHYSHELDKIFFEELEIPQPKYFLNIGSGTHGEQTGKMLIEIEKVLMKEKPDIILVQGDTNTVLSGSLAASKMGIKVGHVEAGLRSFDRTMPEEVNRVLTDHISDFLFVPTIKAKENLLKEGIIKEKIFVIGNTIVDAAFQNMQISKKKIDILSRYGLRKKEYFLITAHRPSNVDNKESLAKLFEGFKKVCLNFKLPLIFPIHPRTKKMMENFNLKPFEGLNIIEPQGYLEFLQLEKNARLILTDSGGVQEEACILKVPSVTLRENTERPETLEVKASILAGNSPEKILSASIEMLNGNKKWKNPFGDGESSKKIIGILRKND